MLRNSFDKEKSVQRITLMLSVLLLIKIGGFFSISESTAITQVYKVISRVGTTMGVLWLWNSLPALGIRKGIAWNQSHLLIGYIAYLALGLASLMWTSDLSVSALQLFMTAESLPFCFLFALIVSCVNRDIEGDSDSPALNPKRIFFRAITPISAIFIIGSFIDPDTFYRGMRGGEEQRLGGWIMNPNELGMLAGIGATLCFLDMAVSKVSKENLFSILINTWCIALTTSRSSFIGLLFIIGLLVLQRGSGKLKIAMFFCMAIAVPVVFDQVIFKSAGGMEEVLSMTGRVPFWKALLNEGFVKEPWFGFGFMRINYIDTFQGVHTYPGRMTHNTFVQVLMNLGIVGFSICILQFTATSVAIVRSANPFLLAVFVPIAVNSITEFGVFGESNFGILFYQLLLCMLVITGKTMWRRADQLDFKRKGGRRIYQDWEA